jgi:uncharacterized repeat protein (TIGR03803 family)
MRKAGRFMMGSFSVSLCCLAVLCIGSPALAASGEAVIYNFKGGVDGASPIGGVIADKAGILYGTTFNAGSSNYGTVFKLAPPAAGGSSWTKTTIHTFVTAPEGKWPQDTLVADSAGALYGTTQNSGSHGAGTVFKLTPPAPGGTAWTFTVLYSFAAGGDGANAVAGLIIDKSGALYGTTEYGGSGTGKGDGTVFKLTPNGGASWTETVLFRFTHGPNGSNPRGGVVSDSAGALYGTLARGGDKDDDGVVFKLIPPVAGSSVWTQQVLYRFTGTYDGGVPEAGVLRDAKSGKLYGTTYYGGNLTWQAGVVYALAPPAAGGTKWIQTVLHSFTGGADGGAPYQGLLVRDASGALYGTTQGIYAHGTVGSYGTVFKLTPPVAGSGAWGYGVLYDFAGKPDGDLPDTGLFLAKTGILYGTTIQGGSTGRGTVFQIAP